MGDNSHIEWTDATWNPVRGCSMVSAGCTNCYAMKQAHRQNGKGRPYEGLTHLTEHGPVWTGGVRLVPELLDLPLRWKSPRRIFVNSMSDLFHEKVPDEFILQVFVKMLEVGHHGYGHIFQILTKRPARMLSFMTKYEIKPDPRIHLGISCEDQPTADERIRLLLQTPADVRWISAEPLLGRMTIAHFLGDNYSSLYGGFENGIDWVVVGGESGPHARPMHPAWARSLRDQCTAAGVPFFFKQWGEWLPRIGSDDPDGFGHPLWPDGRMSDARSWESGSHMNGSVLMYRVGKKRAGRLLDGREWNEMPIMSPIRPIGLIQESPS